MKKKKSGIGGFFKEFGEAVVKGDQMCIRDRTKPDLVAPGVNIQAPDVYGSFLPVTGTSFATPIVRSAAAPLTIGVAKEVPVTGRKLP